MNTMTQMVLPRTILLTPYLLLPLCMGWVIVDQWLLGGYFKAVLPFSFTSIFILRSFLSIPHILGSTLTLCDSEYINHYWKRFVISLVFIVPFSFLLHGQYPRFFQVFMELATAVHVIGQQFNMAPLMTRLKREAVFPWKMMGMGLAAAIYILISLRLVIPEQEAAIRSGLISAIVLGGLAFSYLSIRLSRKVLDQEGKLYIWGNLTFAIAAFGFGVLGYPFFALTVGQVIHDFTAYCFYVVHDSNRNRFHVKNWLYGLFKPFGVPVVFLCPLLSLALAYPFNLSSGGAGLTAVFVFFHYYTETFLWKHSAPHREWVTVS